MFSLISSKQTLFLCGLASAALLVIAFGFEYVGGLAPCKLCLWQRWPHAGVITFSTLGAAGVLRPGPALLLIAFSAAVTAAIAGYHLGVEQQFWPGPTSCSGTAAAMSTTDLLDHLLATPVVRCDEIAWSFANISMAGWNMLFSSGLACFALLAYRKTD
jgi:disulfide bond formation protein DsbB